MNSTISFAFLAMLAGLPTTAFAELESVMLRDNISQGYGMINLFEVHRSSKTSNPINGQTLQAFREQHGGILAFVVDVNEAANGTEKASTQGVAVAEANLIFDFSGTKITCSKFTTNTASMLALKGQTARTEYPTLLGATGSNLITPSTASDLYGTDFSAMLRLKLDNEACGVTLPSLSNVTSAYLEVRFVDTNVKLGDPEAFYDFSNGPEDIAIISIQDVEPVEKLQAGVEEAPLVIAKSQVTKTVDAWSYYPSDNNFYVVSYEDKYPNKGDYDFNDLVIGYRVGLGLVYNESLRQNEVTSIVATGYMIARGAEYTHDWYLRIPTNTPVSGTVTKNLFVENTAEQVANYPQLQTINGEINIQVLKNTKQMMAVSGSPFVNTVPDQALVLGKKFSLSVNLDTPILLSEFSAPPYDPYLHVIPTNFEVHLSGFQTQISSSANFGADSQFKDENGFPYALIFPDDWYPPYEGTDLGNAYNQFLNYTISPSSSNETWYLSPKDGEVNTISKAFWNW
ncbi:hypothetical protein PALB_680 [Pseudoalteromonas luteoviolacea B = ATCC 29581]|nr:hypothetical protein PALB_680 [Pseudoalteromonas luteoviolacea B = ATCC 29581]